MNGHVRVSRTFTALALAAALALPVPGCARPFTVVVEDSGPAMTSAQAERLAATTDISALASVDATAAVALRSTVLADLRSRGDFGTRAADLLTIGFPEQTPSVPVLVRSSKVDGVDAVVVIEAFATGGGILVHRRLWVFDRATGAVLRAASVR
jgi:hypothetical protein